MSTVAVLALALYGTFLLIAGVMRALIQYRRTGDLGARHGHPGTAQWWGSLLAGILAPLAEITGQVRGPVSVLRAVLVVIEPDGVRLAQRPQAPAGRSGGGEAARPPLVVVLTQPGSPSARLRSMMSAKLTVGRVPFSAAWWMRSAFGSVSSIASHHQIFRMSCTWSRSAVPIWRKNAIRRGSVSASAIPSKVRGTRGSGAPGWCWYAVGAFTTPPPSSGAKSPSLLHRGALLTRASNALARARGLGSSVVGVAARLAT